MKYVLKTLQLLLLLFGCYVAASLSTAQAVPARPNKAILLGTVKEYSITSANLAGMRPEQVLYKLTIFVEASEEVKGLPNFIKNKEGRTVDVYSKEKLSSELFGQRIKAVVEYLGDERGGFFWIRHIEKPLK
jgi:hypothetical protein